MTPIIIIRSMEHLNFLLCNCSDTDPPWQTHTPPPRWPPPLQLDLISPHGHDSHINWHLWICWPNLSKIFFNILPLLPSSSPLLPPPAPPHATVMYIYQLTSVNTESPLPPRHHSHQISTPSALTLNSLTLLCYYTLNTHPPTTIWICYYLHLSNATHTFLHPHISHASSDSPDGTFATYLGSNSSLK